jgi:hypothetical protein
MSDNLCDNCERVISAEQARVFGCCANCERQLHKTWATLDNNERGSQ